MFKILKSDEIIKETAIDEDDETSSDEEKRNLNTQNNIKEEDSGSDSDPLDGELTGKEQAALYSNIKGTID
jgi:hypothetical protein